MLVVYTELSNIETEVAINGHLIRIAALISAHYLVA